MADEQTSSEYVFWRGPARLIAGQIQREVNCRVFLSASSSQKLRISVENQFGFAVLNSFKEEAVRIEMPDFAEPIELLPISTSINSRGDNTVEFGLKRSPIWLMKPDKLRLGRTLIINFAEYRVSGPGYPRFELRARGWMVQFIPISDRTLAVAEMLNDDKYRITHQAEFAREDGSLFTAAEARDFLEKLSLFLSFCRGQWVGTSFTVAVNSDGDMALEQWGTGRVSLWREPSNWLDQHHGNAIEQLYEPFCEKLEDESWNDALAHIVYWFTRAETDNVGPDGACILLQATLERLAWHLLVRERRAISEKGFRDLAAADQLRLMLNVLSIPAAVPVGLVQLGALAKSKGLDGPEVFTFIRNRLVHPPKASSAREKLPYYEAYCLAKWYVELAVLSACGYVGDYSNRTLTRRWVGQVEKVPWV
jgi:hypothetical protein